MRPAEGMTVRPLPQVEFQRLPMRTDGRTGGPLLSRSIRDGLTTTFFTEWTRSLNSPAQQFKGHRADFLRMLVNGREARGNDFREVEVGGADN